jgi:putative heme-binding domain-containing protein
MYFTQGALNKGAVTAVKSGNKVRVDGSCQVRFSLDHEDIEVVSTGPSNMWGMQLRNNGQWYGTEANDRAYSVVPYEHGTAMTGVASVKLRPYQPYLPEMHQFRVGGTGISGLAFSDSLSGGFPAEWKDVAILANPITSTLNAVKIERTASGAVKAEHLEDLLVCSDDWFRPVNAEFGPDGCLYIADWYNKIVSHNEVSTGHPDRDRTHGRIWRIRHESQKVRPIPNVKKASNKDLVKHIQAPNLWEMRAAWYQIVDRGAKELAPQLMEIVGNKEKNPVTRIHALWALEGLKKMDPKLMAALIADENSDIRREAIRSLATYEVAPENAAKLIAPYVEDFNCMVRSQTLRTLRDLKKANLDTVALLVSACKPALEGNTMGGSYERNFERFLARYALESYQSELIAFLKTAEASKLPAENILWAIQALDAKEREVAFLQLWKKVSSSKLDEETFVAVANMLDSKKVAAAVKANLTDANYAADYVSYAVANRSRVASKSFIKLMVPQVKRVLNEDPKEGLKAIAALNLGGFDKDIAKLKVDSKDVETMKLLIAAQSVAGKKHLKSFEAMAKDASLPLDLRIAAMAAYAKANHKSAAPVMKGMLGDLDSAQKRQLVSVVSQSKQGADMLFFEFYLKKLLTADAFELSAAERVQAIRLNDDGRTRLMTEVLARIAEEKKQVHAKIEAYMKAAETLTGDPVKGKETFAACLMCHRVGDEGLDIAPPLDGSGHRDLEHLLTAIVDPDAAVEGGYNLYQITKKDGSTAEGYLVKKDGNGTTVAMMGGAEIFVSKGDIKKQGFSGRSFMPANFGNLPAQTMVDLIEYIKTLK